MEHQQVENAVALKSAWIYLPISIGAAVLFLLIATLIGNYTFVARIGGMIWVGLLSLIVSMPIVIARVKKQLQGSARSA